MRSLHSPRRLVLAAATLASLALAACGGGFENNVVDATAAQPIAKETDVAAVDSVTVDSPSAAGELAADAGAASQEPQ